MADPTEPEEVEEGEAPKKNWRRDLEDRLEAAEARAQANERRAAIAEAGLSHLNAKQRQALQTVHDGEWSPEAIKATADEVFGKQPEGQSNPPVEQSEDKGDPIPKGEASELGELSQSPADHDRSDAPIRTQEAFDNQVRSFESEEDLDAFLRKNIDLLPYGSTSPG